jgi:hypothetical protein
MRAREACLFPPRLNGHHLLKRIGLPLQRSAENWGGWPVSLLQPVAADAGHWLTASIGGCPTPINCMYESSLGRRWVSHSHRSVGVQLVWSWLGACKSTERRVPLSQRQLAVTDGGWITVQSMVVEKR